MRGFKMLFVYIYSHDIIYIVLEVKATVDIKIL